MSQVAEQEATRTAMDKLYEFLEERRRSGKPTGDMEEYEEQLHRLVAEVECEGVAEELERYDIDMPVVLVEGVAHRRVVRCEETYFSPAGPVRVMRSLYSSRSTPGERGLCPLELRAGIVEGKWTARAAKQALWFVAQLTPAAVEELYKRLGGLMPSKTSLDKLPKAMSARWEAERQRFERELREQESVPEEACTLGVSLDGVMVPMKDGNRREKRGEGLASGKRTSGPAGHKEVGIGTLTLYDKTGAPISTTRLGRMPEPSKATLKEMLSAELAFITSQRPNLTVVRLADGAKDNWTFLDSLPVKGPRVLDFFHASEHLSKALDTAYGEGSPKARSQLEKLRHILRHEHAGAEKVIRALVHLLSVHPQRKALKTELEYFRKHRHMMHYAELAEKKLPIGTGITEAACKTLATQRMKCSGMAWRDKGGQAILTLRSTIQSARFDRAWDLLAAAYKADVSAPNNVVELRRG